MRWTVQLLLLFGLAAAAALLVSQNEATVTVFWSPSRIDLSLNLVLVGLALLFLILHLGLRALAVLLALPRGVRQWQVRRREQALHQGLLDAWAHGLAGRYVRARTGAERALQWHQQLAEGGASPAVASRVLGHLLAAEAAQALRDRTLRDRHWQQALDASADLHPPTLREAVLLSAARWQVDDRQGEAALDRLDQLPQGAARRTVALRLRLRAARLAQRSALALDTVRLLGKHHAFSAAIGNTLRRRLAVDLLARAHDARQVLDAWGALDPQEQSMLAVRVQALSGLLAAPDVEASDGVGLFKPLPAAIWDGTDEPAAQRWQAIVLIERALQRWGEALLPLVQGQLEQVERRLGEQPGEPMLCYWQAVLCLNLQLWGKAQQALQLVVHGPGLRHLADADVIEALRRRAWCHLADLAALRGEDQAQREALRHAAWAGLDLPQGLQ